MKKPLQILLSEELRNMLDDLKVDLATSTYSGVITQAVNTIHRTYHPSYKQSVATGSVETLEKRVKNKIVMKDIEAKVKEDARINPYINSCINDFKGEVVNGMCRFTVYGISKDEDTQEEVDLEICTPEMAEVRMFLPTKNAVLSRRKDLKKLYD